MPVTVIANRRWFVLSPSRYRLARLGNPIDLVFDGARWHLTDGKTTIAAPNTYTGAMMLHKRLNALACRDRDDVDFTLEHFTEPL
jgi:hypothetical protein